MDNKLCKKHLRHTPQTPNIELEHRAFPWNKTLAGMKALIGFATRCACIMALWPTMLLWPCFVRANCCCSQRELPSELLTCDAAVAPPPAGDEATNQANRPLACTMCSTATGHKQARATLASDGSNVCSTDWLARCNCQYQRPTTAQSELEQLARPSKKSWSATLGEPPGKQIFAHSATGPAPLSVRASIQLPRSTAHCCAAG